MHTLGYFHHGIGGTSVWYILIKYTVLMDHTHLRKSCVEAMVEIILGNGLGTQIKGSKLCIFNKKSHHLLETPFKIHVKSSTYNLL